MALQSSGGNTDVIAHANSVGALTDWSALIWLYPDVVNTTFAGWLGRGDGAAPTGLAINVGGSNPAGKLQVSNAASTTNWQVTSNNGTLQAAEWNCIGIAADFDNAAGSLLYHATYPNIIADVKNATDDTDGVGTVTGANDDFHIMNFLETGFDTNSPDGAIQRVQIFSNLLTAAELQEIQYKPHVALKHTLVLWSEYGYNGTGTQLDLSGNGRTGAVTGLTTRGSINLGWPSSPVFYSFPAAAAAGDVRPRFYHHRHHNQAA